MLQLTVGQSGANGAAISREEGMKAVVTAPITAPTVTAFALPASVTARISSSRWAHTPDKALNAYCNAHDTSSCTHTEWLTSCPASLEVPTPQHDALLVSPQQLLQPMIPYGLFGFKLLCLFAFTVNFQVQMCKLGKVLLMPHMFPLRSRDSKALDF